MGSKALFNVVNDKKRPVTVSGKNIKVETKHSLIHIPLPDKDAELDLKIETSGPSRVKSNNFTTVRLMKYTPLVSMLFIIILALLANYQTSQINAMSESIDNLMKRVDELSLNSEVLMRRLKVLQQKYKSERQNSLIDDDLKEMSNDDDSTFDIKQLFDKSNFSRSNIEEPISEKKNTLNSSTENTVSPNVSVTAANEIPVTEKDLILKNNSEMQEVPNTAEDGSVNRVKRSNRRGNQKRPAGGRRSGNLNKKSKNHGVAVLHLKGAVPEQYIEDQGLIAPWYIDEKASGDFPLSRYEMKDGKGSVEITEPGLYYIYAQVFYLTPELTNSFIITLQEQDKSKLEDLALCSANGSSNKQTTEVSCFTSLVRFLNTTDRIFLRQRERKRRIILREGHSFLGVVLLNGKKSSR